MKNYMFPLLSLLIVSCSQEKSQITSADNLISSYEEFGTEIKLTNQYFKHFAVKNGELTKDIILQIKQTEHIQKGLKQSNSFVEIKPYKFDSDWKINTKAHEIKVKNNTLTTIFKSSGDIEDTYSLYNVNSGEHLLNATYSVLNTEIPETNFKRYIGFTSKANASDLLNGLEKDVIGLLTYASENKTLQQFLIKSTERLTNATPDMELVTLDETSKLFNGNQSLYFWGLDKDYKTKDIYYAFGLTYYIGEDSNESALMFVVKDDEISLENAKFNPKVFTISSVF